MNEKLKALGMNIVMVVLFLALGPGLFYYGTSTLVSGPGTEVTCGGKVMHEGDVCRETRHGSSVGTQSYREKRDEQNGFMSRFGWPIIALIISAVVLLGGFMILWAAVIKKRQGGPSAPAGP
jgi:hypothetical protein